MGCLRIVKTDPVLNLLRAKHYLPQILNYKLIFNKQMYKISGRCEFGLLKCVQELTKFPSRYKGQWFPNVFFWIFARFIFLWFAGSSTKECHFNQFYFISIFKKQILETMCSRICLFPFVSLVNQHTIPQISPATPLRVTNPRLETATTETPSAITSVCQIKDQSSVGCLHLGIK